MDERFVRTALVFGEDGMARIQGAHVAVFGVGGVGGHCIQALARAGVGEITVVDDDVVISPTPARASACMQCPPTPPTPKTATCAFWMHAIPSSPKIRAVRTNLSSILFCSAA